MKEFIEAMKNNVEYKFIFENIGKLSKQELTDILGWYMYAISYSSEHPKKDCSFEEDVREIVMDNIIV